MKHLEAQYSSKSLSDSYSPNYKTLVDHEIGHHVDWTIFGAKGNGVRNAWKEWASSLSGYAGADKREYMAESFVALVNNETRRVSPDYIAFLRQKLKRHSLGETTGIARKPAELRSLTGELIKKAFKL